MRFIAWFLIVLQVATPAWAGPEGGVVAAGSAAIDASQPNTTAITQHSARAIVNWQGFSTAAHESVTFAQPSADAVALNRVTGGGTSHLDGALTANGRVFILNQNGVVIGKTARVNVGGLVASSLEMSDADFMAGRHHLTRPASGKLAAVVNQGIIRTAEGGAVALVGPVVSNQGTIEAPVGRVALAAGTRAVVNLDSAQLVNLALPDGAAHDVSVPASGVSDALKAAVNDSAIVEGGHIREENGRIFLGKAEGLAVNEGVIRVDGRSGAAAGRISIDSTRASVAMAASRLSARGNGLGSPGGDARVLSRGTSITAPTSLIDVGAGASGDGGFAEVSGDRHVKAHGTVLAQAPDGKLGTYLIDPSSLTILDGPFNAGDPVDVIREGTIESSGADVLLQADTITFRNLTTDGILTLPNGVSMDVAAGRITFDDPNDIVFASSSTAQLSFSIQGDGSAVLPRLIAGRVQIFGSALPGTAGSLTFNTISALGPPPPAPPPPQPPPGGPPVPEFIPSTVVINGLRSVRGGSIDAAAASVDVFVTDNGLISVGNVTAAGDIRLTSPTITPPNQANLGGRLSAGNLVAGKSVFGSALASVTVGDVTAGGDVSLVSFSPPSNPSLFPITLPLTGPVRSGNVDANGSIFVSGSTITMGSLLSRRISTNAFFPNMPASLVPTITIASSGTKFQLVSPLTPPGVAPLPGFPFALPDPDVSVSLGNVRALQGTISLSTPGRLTFDTLIADTGLFLNAVGQSGVKGNLAHLGGASVTNPSFPALPFNPGLSLSGLTVDVPSISASDPNSFVQLNSQITAPLPFFPSIPVIATGTVSLGQVIAGSVFTFGEIVDTNGPAINIAAKRVFLNGTRAGRRDDPIEIAGGATLSGFTSELLAVDATGDITIAPLNSSQIQLRAAGSIFASKLDESDVEFLPHIDTRGSSGDVLLAAGGVIGTLANPLIVNIAPGTLAVSAAGQQGGVSIAIKGVVSPTNALVRLNSPPGKVLFNGLQDGVSPATLNTVDPGVVLRQASLQAVLASTKDGRVTQDEFLLYLDELEQLNPDSNWEQLISQLHESSPVGADRYFEFPGWVDTLDFLDFLGDEPRLFVDNQNTILGRENVRLPGNVALPRYMTRSDGELVDIAHSFAGVRAGAGREDPMFWAKMNTTWGDFVTSAGGALRSKWTKDQEYGNDLGKNVLSYLLSSPNANLREAFGSLLPGAGPSISAPPQAPVLPASHELPAFASAPALARPALPPPPLALPTVTSSGNGQLALVARPVTLQSSDGAGIEMPRGTGLRLLSDPPRVVNGQTSYRVEGIVNGKPVQGWAAASGLQLGKNVAAPAKPVASSMPVAQTAGVQPAAAAAPQTATIAPAATVAVATAAAAPAPAAPTKLTPGQVVTLQSGVTVRKSNSPSGAPVVDVPVGAQVTIDSGLILNGGQAWYAVKVTLPGSGTSYGYVPAATLK